MFDGCLRKVPVFLIDILLALIVILSCHTGCCPSCWIGGPGMDTIHSWIWHGRCKSRTTHQRTIALSLVDDDPGHTLHADHGSGPGCH